MSMTVESKGSFSTFRGIKISLRSTRSKMRQRVSKEVYKGPNGRENGKKLEGEPCSSDSAASVTKSGALPIQTVKYGVLES